MAITIHDYYHYKPSVDAAIVVAVLYSLAFTGTLLQFLRYRSWVWTVMVLASGSEHPSNAKLQKATTDNLLVEAAGYITRVISAKNVDNKDPYIIQFTLVVLAPVLMAAACYIVFVCSVTVGTPSILKAPSRGESFSTLFQKKHEQPDSFGYRHDS
jgi:hypothetical protein